MSIDVNEAFRTEKTDQLAGQRAARDAAIKAEADKAAWLAGQLASGHVEQVNATTYRYTQGWDRGEMFTVNLNAAGTVQEIIPQHGLDTTATGAVALYSAVPAWHGLGQIIPGGTTDIDDVLRLSGLDFEVTTVPALYRWGEQIREHADRFHTVRTDTGAALGAVGRKYTPIQNRQGFEFLQELVNSSDVGWESAGLLRGGARVFVSIRLPEAVTVDAEGINDTIVPFVAVMNDHSGQGQFQCVVTPWRPVCANTERFAVRDAHSRWSVRHTAGATSEIKEARRTLGLSVQYFERFAAEETALARTDIAVTEFRELIADLWPLDDDASDRTRTSHANRLGALEVGFRTETERVGRTAYAAERAITGYLDHVAPRRPGRSMTEELARAAAALEGNDDELKSRTHRRLLALRQR
jgi:phage/plasmid-like protein (TIGR03299 family)